MAFFYEKYSVPNGLRVKSFSTRVDQVCREAAHLATRKNRMVFFSFDGIELAAKPMTDFKAHANTLWAEYENKFRRREKTDFNKRRSQQQKQLDAHVAKLGTLVLLDEQVALDWLVVFGSLGGGEWDPQSILIKYAEAGWSTNRDVYSRIEGESVNHWQRRIGPLGQFHRLIAYGLDAAVQYGETLSVKFERQGKRLIQEIKERRKVEAKARLTTWNDCHSLGVGKKNETCICRD